MYRHCQFWLNEKPQRKLSYVHIKRELSKSIAVLPKWGGQGEEKRKGKGCMYSVFGLRISNGIHRIKADV